MERETRLVHAGRDPERHHGIVNPPALPGLHDPLPDDGRLRAPSRAPLHRIRLRHPRHPDDHRPGGRPGGALRRRPDPAPLVGPLGGDADADRLPPAGRPPAGRGHGLRADARVLHRGPRALRRGGHLLRPAGRGGHRRPHPSDHAGRLPRVPGVADVRGPGRPRHRRRCPRPRSPRASWTTPGRRRSTSGRSSTAWTSRSRR